MIPLLYFTAAEKHENDCWCDVDDSADEENILPFLECALKSKRNLFSFLNLPSLSLSHLFSCEVRDDHR
jgi:hypothetical protein